MAWSRLPGCPDRISVHPAPTPPDVMDAARDARRRQPDWLILDTEGTTRGAMTFINLRPDLVVTPLAGSQLEANEAINAAEMVAAFGRRAGRALPFRCLLTRIPAAIRPRSLKSVIQQMHERGIEFLPTALLEKEAFRVLFQVGGGLAALEAEGVTGLASARANAEAYL